MSKEKWELQYWCDNKSISPIEQWLDALTKEQLKSVAKELKLLELCGNTLKLPHSRSLSKGLFELRERQYGYRIYYTFLRKHIILMMHAGDKKNQERDISIARKRLDVFTLNEERLLQ